MLASIPVAAGYLLAAWTRLRRENPRAVPYLLWFLVWLPLAVLWFVFLPNTCYLLTEWRHFFLDSQLVELRDQAITPRQQLDVARYGFFFLMYSGYGVLCYTLAIRAVAKLFGQSRLKLLPFAIPFFLLLSIGVYLGLIVRLNSWDLFLHPALPAHYIVHAFTSPHLLKVIVIFAVLLWFLYETINIWVDGLWTRLHPNAASFPSPVRRKRKSQTRE